MAGKKIERRTEFYCLRRLAIRRNLLGLGTILRRIPRVTRVSQPWDLNRIYAVENEFALTLSLSPGRGNSHLPALEKFTCR